MPYTTEEIVEPFWAEYSSEASGRDPLAIQNSSVVIYTKMIVGITNVTNRIRYNGFYCWLFDIILKNASKKNSLVDQIRYLRRAELLLASMMVEEFPTTTGVSGSAFAAKNIQSRISLRDGADWESKKEGNSLYWKFKSGVFGQYYSGVVRELNLINHPQTDIDLNVYTLTAKGEELALAFSNNIPDKEGKLFWECVFNGSVSQDQLSELTSFALHTIPEGSHENSFYSKMLLSEDDRKLEPTFHRKNTIKLILKFLQSEKDGVENLTTAFLKFNYQNHYKLKDISLNTDSAWYLFEINELIHVVFEHFHGCFLYAIEEFPTNIDETIARLLKEIESEFKQEEIESKIILLNDLSGSILKESIDVYDHYYAMEAAFNDDNYASCLHHGIKTILKLYNNCKNHIPQLKDFAELQENNFNRTGYAIELFQDLVESKWNYTVENYAKSILLEAINRHTFSSYSKTKIGQSLVHNYMIEENAVWRLRETLPNRTSPRLQNTVQYLSDLGWLQREGKMVSITKLGIKVLEAL